ncbi:MAG: hypothetical protein WCO35_02610 [Candidatus Nomurabacteria bacterium]
MANTISKQNKEKMTPKEKGKFGVLGGRPSKLTEELIRKAEMIENAWTVDYYKNDYLKKEKRMPGKARICFELGINDHLISRWEKDLRKGGTQNKEEELLERFRAVITRIEQLQHIFCIDRGMTMRGSDKTTTLVLMTHHGYKTKIDNNQKIEGIENLSDILKDD